MYTSLSDIERRKALSQSLRDMPMRRNGYNKTSALEGIAHLIRQWGAGKAAKIASEQEAANDKLMSKELNMYANALRGEPAFMGMQPGEVPEFSHPDVAKLQIANMIKQSSKGPTANIQDVEYYAKMPEGPEKDLMRQAIARDQWLNTGSQFTLANPVGGQQFINKNLAPEKQTTYLQEAEAAKKRGQSAGDFDVNRGKTESQIDAKGAQLDTISSSIQSAKDMSDSWTTGFLGAVASNIPGTKAHDLQNTLNTIKANIGFDKLAEMRANSPTGGALGQVSEMENRLLQAVWGSLEQSQSKEQFEKNLDLVQKQVQDSYERLREAYQKDLQRFGAEAMPNVDLGGKDELEEFLNSRGY